jgi:predicted PurR-regulated permease PerM
VIAGIDYQSVFPVFLVLLVIVIAQMVDNFFVVPILLAKVTNLHPLVVLFAVLIGYQILDIPGMIIGVPIVSILKLAVQETYKELLHRRPLYPPIKSQERSSLNRKDKGVTDAVVRSQRGL